MNNFLLKLIKTAISSAAVNGYNFNEMTVEDIAIDLHMYDSDIEHYQLEDVEECVRFLKTDQI